MSKNEILKIANEILDEGVVAVHGTSIENAKSIMATGLNGNRTTYIVISGKRDPKVLATYGWKENAPGDAANVVINVPKKYLELLIGYTPLEAEAKIEYFRNAGLEEEIIRSFMDIKVETMSSYSKGMFKIPPIQREVFKIPKEFIRGCFVYVNNTSCRSFLSDKDGKFDYEKALENLIFIDNPEFFCNLSEEQQDEFIKIMREKVGLEQPKR